MVKRNWCDICRDEKSEIKCSQRGCPRRFHLDCLRSSGLIDLRDNGEGFLCDDCDLVDENDNFCFRCRKVSQDDLLCCDGCTKSAHLTCVNLTQVPDTDEWLCPICDPTKPKSTVATSRQSGKPKVANVLICYVCQKSGKLLGCDCCEQSFHPKCIDVDFIEFNVNEDWRCPICKGVDPLKNMGHKRLTKAARTELSHERQQCIKKQGKRCKMARDRFLWSHRSTLKPFTSPEVLNRLQKNITGTEEPRRLLKRSSSGSSTEDSQPLSDGLYTAAEGFAGAGNWSLLKAGVTLKPYQRLGVSWLLDAYRNKGGAILADEMGLGKTIETLAFLSALRAEGIHGPHLIVVPLSTVGNWIWETRRFTPHFNFTKICGSRSEREHSMSDPIAFEGVYDLYFTTYETTFTEQSFFTDRFNWQVIVLDEAHRIKNETGRVRHSLDRVTSTMRVLLTGTPLQNNIRELFTLLNFIAPDVLTRSEQFEQAFQLGNGVGVRPDEGFESLVDATRIQAVNELLSKLMLRRTKEMVVRLPQKIHRDVWLPLSPLSAGWYRRLIQLSDRGLNRNDSINKLLGTIVKMRIVCCHPRGMVSRESQLNKLKQSFVTEGERDLWPEMEKAAKELKSIEAIDHVRASSKLIFLDLLLCQLHGENLVCIPGYEESYGQWRSQFADQSVTLASSEEWKSHYVPNLFSSYLSPAKLTDISSSPSRKIKIIEEDEEIPTDDFVTPTDPSMHTEDVKTEPPAPSTDPGMYTDKVKSSAPSMHKVLVFTQFQLVLDELEKYCQWRGWRYMRLDGSTNKIVRELDIREFSSAESQDFIFLISTRAGGLGINLVTANHVVMYDQDWNPFVDLQAIDRAHRIGQRRDVHIWRLITEWTVEERMAFRRDQKLKLDRLVVQATMENTERDLEEGMALAEDKLSSQEIRKLLIHGRSAIMGLAAVGSDSMESLTLAGLMKRPRAELPEYSETPSPTETDQSIDVTELDVDVATQATTPETDEGGGHHYNEEGLWRSNRQKKQVKLQYVPESLEIKPKNERKLVHEKSCFVCNKKQNQKDDSIVNCFRCPKSYHLSKCLGLDSLPSKAWSCGWHECCLCFRKGSTAGGMLLHCAECPTAFCFDCFPPEYRRHHASAEFWLSLQRRGWSVTSNRMPLFLCSRCKAVQEQDRRKQLSCQQLAAQMEKQRLAHEQAKEDAEVERLVNAEIQKTKKQKLETRAEFGRKVREVRETDKDLENRLRDAYSKLWPMEYINLIKQRNSTVSTKPESSAEASTPPPSRLMKLPGESLLLCDNCRLPLHDSSNCFNPPETVRVSVPVGISSIEFDVDGAPVQPPPPSDTKLQIRQFCSTCGASSRMHTRKLCPKRPEGTDQQTEVKRSLYRRLIDEIGKESAVCIPEGFAVRVEAADNLRRRLQPMVVELVRRASERAEVPNVRPKSPEANNGMHTAIDSEQTTLSTLLIRRKKRVTPSDEDSARTKKKRLDQTPATLKPTDLVGVLSQNSATAPLLMKLLSVFPDDDVEIISGPILLNPPDRPSRP